MDRRTAREVLRLLDGHHAFALATVVRTTGSVPGKLGATMIVRSDGSTLGTVGGAGLEEAVKERAAQAIAARAGDVYHYDLQKWKAGGLASLCGGSVDVAVEFVAARPNLLLWGGGHVSAAVARLLPALEYDYSVADDRPEYVTADRFPSADRRVVVDPAELWEEFDPVSFSHLYVLGYDATKDAEVLARSLDRFPNFIGFIASASKRVHTFHDLRVRGATESALARIRSPVGLSIGAETPSEIAVSIVAELIRSVRPQATASVRKAERVAATGGGRGSRSRPA